MNSILSIPKLRDLSIDELLELLEERIVCNLECHKDLHCTHNHYEYSKTEINSEIKYRILNSIIKEIK